MSTVTLIKEVAAANGFTLLRSDTTPKIRLVRHGDREICIVANVKKIRSHADGMRFELVFFTVRMGYPVNNAGADPLLDLQKFALQVGICAVAIGAMPHADDGTTCLVLDFSRAVSTESLDDREFAVTVCLLEQVIVRAKQLFRHGGFLYGDPRSERS